MNQTDIPIFYSFRRCPYAIRARLALAVARVQVDLREVVLRDKPDAFLQTSPSGTVPCLQHVEGVIDESLDVMIWALQRHDPQGWLDMPAEGWDWIARCDGAFKTALDRTKYATRYPDADPQAERAKAMAFLQDLDQQINGWVFAHPTIADYAILPFVRQFAFIDKAQFDRETIPQVQAWLAGFLGTQAFADVMGKYPQWIAGSDGIVFPGTL
ncbi:glutathione S-transferase [Ascidiaceihabitans sp.]|uniref:glutathione S-transferase n=1 Tax=Ascidiaceihabitans sp. TaxID=1872644 RepID=UPI0032996C6D